MGTIDLVSFLNNYPDKKDGYIYKMEPSKKNGRNSSFAKHLRKTKGKWTKAMANSKARLTAKKLLKISSD